MRSIQSSEYEIPPVIYPALCRTLIAGEALDQSTQVVVIGLSQPIFRTSALRAGRGREVLTLEDVAEDEARDAILIHEFKPSRVAIPGSHTDCAWKYLEGPAPELTDTDTLVLEFSGVVGNPFAGTTQPEHGVFARLSIGRASGASWYWVALRGTGDAATVTQITKLSVSDG